MRDQRAQHALSELEDVSARFVSAYKAFHVSLAAALNSDATAEQIADAIGDTGTAFLALERAGREALKANSSSTNRP